MIVQGYAALFGIVDQGNDMIRAGAFRQSLARRQEPLPMYLEHSMKSLAGHWSEVREDARGLYVRGEIGEGMPGARRAERALARGVDGLSIGFIPVVARRDGKGRVLEEIDVLEVSIVSLPMQPLARLSLVRSDFRAVA